MSTSLADPSARPEMRQDAAAIAKTLENEAFRVHKTILDRCAKLAKGREAMLQAKVWVGIHELTSA